MTREEACRLLGVSADADPEQVRRAWRMWAKYAHPDSGGDAQEFASLARARDALLAVPAPVSSDVVPVVPRATWRAVVHAPASRSRHALVILVLLAVGAAAFPAILATPVAAAPAAVLAVSAAWAVSSACLSGEADAAHRVSAAAWAWGIVVVAQVGVSSLAGASLLPLLPLLAVPFVALVALVLAPGRGLLLARPR